MKTSETVTFGNKLSRLHDVTVASVVTDCVVAKLVLSSNVVSKFVSVSKLH